MTMTSVCDLHSPFMVDFLKLNGGEVWSTGDLEVYGHTLF